MLKGEDGKTGGSAGKTNCNTSPPPFFQREKALFSLVGNAKDEGTELLQHIYIGAGDGTRTRDPNLGKVVLYH